jgi:hypothetical protein
MDVDEDDHGLVAGEAAAAKAVEAAATARPRTNQAAGSGGATAAGCASMDVDEKENDDDEEEVQEREGHTDDMLSMSPFAPAETTLQLDYIAPVTPDDLALKEDEGTAAASTATKSSKREKPDETTTTTTTTTTTNKKMKKTTKEKKKKAATSTQSPKPKTNKKMKKTTKEKKKKAATSTQSPKPKISAFDKGMKKLGDPSVPLSKLTGPEWKAVLAAAADGTIEPSTPGGALPSAATAYKGANGVTANDQYQARYEAWDQGQKNQPRPAPSYVRATSCPPSQSKRHTGELSDEELENQKRELHASWRKEIDAHAATGVSELEVSTLRDALAFVERKMPPAFAAELASPAEGEGDGRERVRELHSPLGFFNEQRREDDEVLQGAALSPEEKEKILFAALLKYYESVLVNNFEQFDKIGGLPYVSPRGSFMVDEATGKVFALVMHGHFHVFYAREPSSSEDISKLELFETGRTMKESLAAFGLHPGSIALFEDLR